MHPLLGIQETGGKKVPSFDGQLILVCSSVHVVYTPFAVRNDPKPVLRYPSIRARLATYLYVNSGHLKIKVFSKEEKRTMVRSKESANGP